MVYIESIVACRPAAGSGQVGPYVVFSTLVGSNICGFCERYAEAGIDPVDIPIASHNVTEAELSAVGRVECGGHITAAPYFSSIQSEANRNFVRAFRERFGAAAPVSQYAASAYSAVRLFALALERAGEMDTQRMMACARCLPMSMSSFLPSVPPAPRSCRPPPRSPGRR